MGSIGASNSHMTIKNPDGSEVSYSILAGYAASDTDLTDGTYNYYGFLRADGSYYLMRTTKNQSEIRYSAGSSAYTTAWTNKATESFDYFNTTF